MNIKEASAEEIENNYGLYQEAIRIMKASGENLPGVCCGRNKKQHCELFVKNREKYIQRMEEIKNRKIQPKWNGILFVSKTRKHYDSNTITDKESLYLIENGFLDKEKYFDVPVEEAPAVDQPVVKDEAPVAPKKTTKKKTTKKK